MEQVDTYMAKMELIIHSVSCAHLGIFPVQLTQVSMSQVQVQVVPQFQDAPYLVERVKWRKLIMLVELHRQAADLVFIGIVGKQWQLLETPLLTVLVTKEEYLI